MTQNTESKQPSESLSIWFFVGLLTLVYGVVLLATGVYEFSHPLGDTVVLSNLHATFWWGLLMTAFGSFYTIRFRPGKG
jgi:hypothetical protein